LEAINLAVQPSYFDEPQNLPVALVGDVGFLVYSMHLVNDLLKVALVFPSTLRKSYHEQVSFSLDKLHRLTCQYVFYSDFD
jgi:hypothetical protein